VWNFALSSRFVWAVLKSPSLEGRG
jgi:hypothetical protein